jgi:hypothetical protein
MKSSLNRHLSEGNIHDMEIEEKYSTYLKERRIPKNKALFPDTVKTLQNSIHQISKKIEEDKINLRIIKERQFKKQSEFNKLTGKPIEKTKEQQLKDMKEKIIKYKNRQIFDPNYGKKQRISLPDEETFLINKNTGRCKLQLDFLRDEINKQILSNMKLSNQIIKVRKDKIRLTEKYEKIEEENKDIEKKLILAELKNKKIYNRINFKDLKEVKEQGKKIETEFIEQRDYLEKKFHNVIEANISREKEHKNELKKLRLKNAIFADKARKNKNNRSMTTVGIKIDDSDEMHDRIPILDTLINKWKYITKFKKNMLNKYTKHAKDVRISLDKLLTFSGLDDLQILPDVIAKELKQLNEIDAYLSGLTTEVDELKKEKNNLEKKIKVLNNSKKNDKIEQINLVEDKTERIEMLKKKNNRLENNMNRRRNIFRQMQEPTFAFLRKMQKTYLTDFVVFRNHVEDNDKLNETNVINFLGTVYCYCQLIRDFDENAKSNINLLTISKESKEINKNIDLLRKDFKMKLTKINYNNCMNNNVQHSIYTSVKKGKDFDETIKRLANEIVDQVTKDTNKSFANISSLNTNIVSS